MKKFFILLVLLVNTTVSITLKTVSQDSPPKYYLDSDGKMTGLAVDTMKAIMKMDPTIVFEGYETFMPLNRIEKELESGAIDVFFAWVKNDDKEKKFIFIDTPVYWVRNILVSSLEEPLTISDWKQIKDLKTVSVMVALGAAQAEYLKQMGVLVDEQGKSNDNNLMKLMSDRGRFAFGSETGMLEQIKNLGYQGRIKIHPIKTPIEGRYISFSKKVPKETVEKIEKTMKKLEENGTLDRIFKKHTE